MKSYPDPSRRDEGDEQPQAVEAESPAADGSSGAVDAEGTVRNGEAGDLVLELGDFLHRIPSHLLLPGPHDVTRKIVFDRSDIGERIAQGETTIPLAFIYRNLPEIFQQEVLESDEEDIRFPWQKVLMLIHQGGDGGASAAEALAQSLKSRPGFSSTAAPVPRRQSFSESQESESRRQAAGRTGSDGERLRREYQRTIAELNRRIIALEGTQKERAQELVKEKEVRLKTERQLAAAERALQDSANQIENTRMDGRRQLEMEVRRRETEAGKIQKEQQKQLDLLQHELRKAEVERDELRARLEDGPAAEAEVTALWESRAIAQFEQDIEDYRARIKTLLEERNALAREKEELAARAADSAGASVTPQSPGVIDELRKQVADLHRVREGLLGQVEALERKAVGEPGATEALAQLKAENERLLSERDHAQQEAEALLTEIDTLRESRRQDREKHELELTERRDAESSDDAGLRRSLDDNHATIAALTEARDAAIAARVEIEAELDALRVELNGLRSQSIIDQGTLAAQLDSVRREHEQAVAALAADRDRAIAELASERAESAGARETLDARAEGELARLREALAEAARSRDALRERVTSLEMEAASRAGAAACLLEPARVAPAEFEPLPEPPARSRARAKSGAKSKPSRQPEAADDSPESNVIDLTEAEVFRAPEQGGIPLPPVRPVTVPPPRIQGL
jgi:hypothetical protein